MIMKRIMTMIVSMLLCMATFAQTSQPSFDQQLTKARIRGDVEVMYNVGLRYYNGDGVAKNERESFIWMLRAALKGHVDAMEQVAYDYMNGIGVEKDLVIGFEWMQAAAEAGQVDAMENVAINKYLDGNYWDAYKWCSKAAAKGSKTAAEWLKDLDEQLYNDQDTTR